MVILTDKNIYLNKNLKEFIDLLIKRKSKKWDNLVILDGMERVGKTTLALTMANYYASVTGANFNVKNVFFDPIKLFNFASGTTEQVIVWDEAAFGGLSKQWANKVQQRLNTMLMVAGKYNHFYIFIVPSFFELNRYLALHRSVALIHCYTPDLVKRGFFALYNMRQKAWVYTVNRKTMTYSTKPSFTGQYVLKNTDKIIDMDVYEKKKDAAIIKYVHDEQNPVEKGFITAKSRGAVLLGLDTWSKVFNLGRAQYYLYRKRVKMLAFESDSSAELLKETHQGRGALAENNDEEGEATNG